MYQNTKKMNKNFPFRWFIPLQVFRGLMYSKLGLEGPPNWLPSIEWLALVEHHLVLCCHNPNCQLPLALFHSFYWNGVYSFVQSIRNNKVQNNNSQINIFINDFDLLSGQIVETKSGPITKRILLMNSTRTHSFHTSND